MEAAIIDYGMGNLWSVQRAFEKCGFDAEIIDSPNLIEKTERIVLPGVGAFPDAVKSLKEAGWIEALNNAVIVQKKPLLGICLGMQLLASYGNEGGVCKGLDYIKGKVVDLKATKKDERIPHVGWNEVIIKNNNGLFKDIKTCTNYYFVHGYHFVPDDDADIVSVTPYCGEFVSAIAHDNIMGVQFHPEKSQKAGFALIKNFMGM
ncbi:MAG: imidazole glycerol phosphate synthase subunit HisH [Lachnospiraceae bacterium]|nr:imidazole glycerol phosphate synthase subunit HisH [Lachnospiraceae bacterium]